MIIAQDRLRNPKILTNTDQINNNKYNAYEKLCLPRTENRSKGTKLGKIRGEKLSKTCAIVGTEACYSTQGDSAPGCKAGQDR